MTNTYAGHKMKLPPPFDYRLHSLEASPYHRIHMVRNLDEKLMSKVNKMKRVLYQIVPYLSIVAVYLPETGIRQQVARIRIDILRALK